MKAPGPKAGKPVDPGGLKTVLELDTDQSWNWTRPLTSAFPHPPFCPSQFKDACALGLGCVCVCVKE